MPHSDQQSCPLCLAATQQAYRTVYTDDLTVVIVNAEPIKDGHLMVMPVRHAEQLSDLTEKEAAAFLRTTDKCLAALSARYQDPPIVVIHEKAHCSQPHLHAHILPSQGGLRDLFAASEKTKLRVRADKERLARLADDIRPFMT